MDTFSSEVQRKVRDERARETGRSSQIVESFGTVKRRKEAGREHQFDCKEDARDE